MHVRRMRLDQKVLVKQGQLAGLTGHIAKLEEHGRCLVQLDDFPGSILLVIDEQALQEQALQDAGDEVFPLRGAAEELGKRATF